LSASGYGEKKSRKLPCERGFKFPQFYQILQGPPGPGTLPSRCLPCVCQPVPGLVLRSIDVWQGSWKCLRSPNPRIFFLAETMLRSWKACGKSARVLAKGIAPPSRLLSSEKSSFSPAIAPPYSPFAYMLYDFAFHHSLSVQRSGTVTTGFWQADRTITFMRPRFRHTTSRTRFRSYRFVCLDAHSCTIF
jgi:hypothetical protein